MCRAVEAGGRRCPAHTPASRRAQRAAKSIKRKVRGRKVKDINCTNAACKNGVVKVHDEDGRYISQALCDVCGGVGFLNDAAGRIRPQPRAKARKGDTSAPVSIEASRGRFRKEMSAAKDDVTKAKAFLGHVERSAEYDPGAANFLNASRGASAREVLTAAAEKRLPVACGCDDGKVNGYDEHNNVVGVFDCGVCSGTGEVA